VKTVGNNRLWDWDDPLQRCPELGESRAANQGLRDYAMMGARRSLRSLKERYSNVAPTEKPPTRYFHTISTWSNKYDWVARVNRWQELEQARTEEEWRDRRREIREREWEQAKALIERAEKMLQYPLHEKVLITAVEDDGAVHKTILKPIRWSSNTIAQFTKTASDLARLAAEMETERTVVEWREKAQEAGINPQELFNDLVDAAAQRMAEKEDDTP
jgi:hypothetical protein